MKKNKFLIALLAALMSCSFAIGFTSCKDDDDSSSGGINSESPKDDDEDDGSTGGDSSNGGSEDDGDDEECEHDWREKDKIEATCTQDGKVIYKCKDCKEEREETIPATGHEFLVHSCIKCDYERISQGLEYELIEGDEGDYYAVTGIGTCEDIYVVIPSYYNNVPVKHIANGAFSETDGINRNAIKAVLYVLPETLETIGSNAFNDTQAYEVLNLSTALAITKDAVADSNNYFGNLLLYLDEEDIHTKAEDVNISWDENGFVTYDTVNVTYETDEDGNYVLDENEERFIWRWCDA